MSIDITGWVEAKPSYFAAGDPEFGRWIPIVHQLEWLVGNDYDALGCLFGVQNYANFVPLAADRGIPSDAAEVIQRRWRILRKRYAGTAEAPFSPSWILWSELKATDWEEEAPLADSRIHQYRRDDQGQLIFETKAGWNRPFAERVFADRIKESLHAAISKPGSVNFPAGQEWEIDGRVYRSEKLKRRDALNAEWHMLFKLMETLASQFGDECVRLVAWFNW